MTPRDQHEADDDSAKAYQLAVKAWREQSIRAGWIEPTTPQERKWKEAGPVASSQLDTVKEQVSGA